MIFQLTTQLAKQELFYLRSILCEKQRQPVSICVARLRSNRCQVGQRENYAPRNYSASIFTSRRAFGNEPERGNSLSPAPDLRDLVIAILYISCVSVVLALARHFGRKRSICWRVDGSHVLPRCSSLRFISDRRNL